MSSEANEPNKAEAAAAPVAKEAPTEQQESRPGVPKRIAPGQTVCSQKNEKGKLCNGHLKEMNTRHASEVHLRGDDALHKCQTCGALYTGPPLGHVRDPDKQKRFVERELAAILQAAGGTLPAYDYPVGSEHAPAGVRRAIKPAPSAPTADATSKSVSASAASVAPAGETPDQKKARLIAEHKAKLAAKQAGQQTAAAATPADAPTPSPTSGTDSSPSADSHRPAAEAQASTGQASAAPMSPAAATASPAAGAETVDDLAPEASTELTPGAPKDERKPAG